MDRIEIMNAYIKGMDREYTHMFIIKNVLTKQAFILYVDKNNYKNIIKEYSTMPYYITESYSYSLDLIKQLHEPRSYHLENKVTKKLKRKIYPNKK